MKEMFKSKVLVSFMIMFIGSAFLVTPDNQNETLIASNDTNNTIVSEYAYI